MMCKYVFWPESVNGLTEEIALVANSYAEALIAVNKHIERHSRYVKSALTLIKVRIECAECGECYEGHEHIDCVGHKDKTQDELVQEALLRDSRYRTFKKLHRRHSLQIGGNIKASGLDLSNY